MTFVQPLILSENVQPICLPLHPRTSSTIYNWGLLVQGWAPGNVKDENNLLLTEININVKSTDQCNNVFKSSSSKKYKKQIERKLPDLLIPSQFCARSASQGHISYGDSGGPAIYEL